MSTILPDPEALRHAEVRQEFDVNDVCREKASSALAVNVIRRTVKPVFEELGKSDGAVNLPLLAAEEAIKNVLHADESHPRIVEVVRTKGGVALRTYNRQGENGGDLDDWMGGNKDEYMKPEKAEDNGLGMRIITEVADDVSVIPRGEMVECWYFFDEDEEGQSFPRIVHDS